MSPDAKRTKEQEDGDGDADDAGEGRAQPRTQTECGTWSVNDLCWMLQQPRSRGPGAFERATIKRCEPNQVWVQFHNDPTFHDWRIRRDQWEEQLRNRTEGQDAPVFAPPARGGTARPVSTALAAPGEGLQ